MVQTILLCILPVLLAKSERCTITSTHTKPISLFPLGHDKLFAATAVRVSSGRHT
jgi:hypothetical protein